MILAVEVTLLGAQYSTRGPDDRGREFSVEKSGGRADDRRSRGRRERTNAEKRRMGLNKMFALKEFHQ